MHMFFEENIFTNSPKKKYFLEGFLEEKKKQLVKLIKIEHLFNKSRFLKLSHGTEDFVSNWKKYKNMNTFCLMT